MIPVSTPIDSTCKKRKEKEKKKKKKVAQTSCCNVFPRPRKMFLLLFFSAILEVEGETEKHARCTHMSMREQMVVLSRL